MENRLKSLFEFQKFENNSRLAKLVRDTELRYGAELTDDELSMVSAAGDVSFLMNSSDKLTEEIEKLKNEIPNM